MPQTVDELQGGKVSKGQSFMIGLKNSAGMSKLGS